MIDEVTCPGAKLRRRRTELGMSLRDAANMMNASYVQLGAVERGEQPPDVSHVFNEQFIALTLRDRDERMEWLKDASERLLRGDRLREGTTWVMIRAILDLVELVEKTDD
jgi:transcriptional regulator with XRE-family HTH domain